MWRCTLYIVLCSVILCRSAFADTSALSANEWKVRSSLGDVSVVAVGAADRRTLKTGQILTAPFAIKAGATGQAVLVRGDDTLLVAPGSEIEVRAAVHSDVGLITRILQSAGDLIYRVEKRPRQRFEVETPYLVSVVKGTRFTISVTGREAMVSLHEGSLEVLSKGGADRVLMKPGEIARAKPGVGVIEVTSVEPLRSQWGRWYPAHALDDSGNSAAPGLEVAHGQDPSYTLHSPGQLESATAFFGTAPGLSGTAPGLSGTAPGLSGTAPGLSGTAPGLSGTAPGLSGARRDALGFAPGLNK